MEMTLDGAVGEVFDTFYYDGILKKFEKTGYTKQNFLKALTLAYGEKIGDSVYDIFIQDAIKSGYCS